MPRYASLSVLAAALASGGANAAGTDVSFNVYGDVDYHVEHAGRTTHSFAAPRLDLFPSGSNGRFSFLGEIVFEAGKDNNFAVDVERIEAAWSFADWLRVRAGRFHTAFGYYNDAFHHGNYFQLPVERPSWVNFEDSGGLIPAHSVGVHLDGRINAGGAGAFRYDLDIANGRGATLNTVQSRIDMGVPKELNFRLRFEPAFLPGLVIGGNAFYSHITANDDPSLVVPIPQMRELIFGAHAAYQEGPLRFIAEAALFQHQVIGGSGATFSTTAALFEAGYAVGEFTPYLLVVRVNLDGGDAYFANSAGGEEGSFTKVRAGLKWIVNDNLALKLEAGHNSLDTGTDITSLAAQAAFAY